MPPPGGCHGVSPTGVHWAYAQPEHSGTVSVVNYLQKQMNVSTCGHDHHSGARFWWLAPPAPDTTEFAFTFVTNPYRRLLSHAAFLGVISGGKIRHNRTLVEEVRRFRRAGGN